MFLTQTVQLALLALVAGAADEPESWPGFRGKAARGLAAGEPPPIAFDPGTGENLRWKTAIPGLAHSSPVVWGDRIYVTSAVREQGEAELSSLFGSPGYGAGEPVPDEGPHEFVLFCVDRLQGTRLWTATAKSGTPLLERHPKATHANCTPAVDATRIIAFFGSEGLFAFDHDGQPLWSRDLGPLNAGAPGYKGKLPWGFGSSPVLHGEQVFVQCDFEGESFLACLDATTGEDVWRVRRDEDSTWCTPAVHAGEHPQVICNGYKHIGGYDLATGAELWSLAGGGDVPVPTPVVAHGMIYLTSAHGPSRPLRAVPLDAKGALTEEDLVWNQARMGVYMQTPLVKGDLVYACSDAGVLGVFDAKTGEQVYRERLGDGKTGFTSSAVSAGDRIWWVGEDGGVLCIKHGREFEVLGRSELGENCLATPAICGGVLYLRGRKHLFAIGSRDAR